jgi:hypothetical protein
MAEIDKMSPISPVLPANKRQDQKQGTGRLQQRQPRDKQQRQEHDTGGGHRVDEYA